MFRKPRPRRTPLISPCSIFAAMIFDTRSLQKKPSDHETCYFNSNDFTAIDTRVDAVMIPVADEITIVRRK